MDRRASRNVRFLATGLIAAAGGALAAVRSAQSARGELPLNCLGGKQRRWRWRENEIFVTELGAGPPVVLIHGIYAGASSYEFRELAPLLARTHRVVAFDFLGCGLSDRPRIPYTQEVFIQQIGAALEEFTSEPALLIASSLSGAFAIRAALRDEERVRGVVAIQPTGLEHQDDVSRSLRQASEHLMRTPVVGEGVFATLTAQVSLRRFLERVYSRPDFITNDVLSHYTAMTRVPGGRYVTAAFIGGSLTCDITSDLPFFTLPLLVLWGDKARIGPSVAKAKEYAALGHDTQLTIYPEFGALPHEEDAARVATDIEHFVLAKRDAQRALTEV